MAEAAGDTSLPVTSPQAGLPGEVDSAAEAVDQVGGSEEPSEAAQENQNSSSAAIQEQTAAGIENLPSEKVF